MAQVMSEVNAGIDRKPSKGGIDVDPQQAQQATGAMGDSFSGGLQFEDVPGVGSVLSRA